MKYLSRFTLKTYAFLILSFIIPILGFSQLKNKPDTYWYPDNKGKLGLKDRTTKNWVISPQYAWISPFSNGLARVNIGGECLIDGNIKVNGKDYTLVVGGKWGYINRENLFVIPPKFDWAEDFDENGLANVNMGISLINDPEDNSYCICFKEENSGAWGQINLKGSLTIPIKNSSIYPLNDEYYLIALETSIIIDSLGPLTSSTLYGVISFNGYKILDFDYLQIKLNPVNKDLFSVQDQNEKWGSYSLSKNKMICSSAYASPLIFYEDLASANISFSSKKGYLTKEGLWAIKPSYEAANSFSEGLALVQQDSIWKVINRKGKVVSKNIGVNMNYFSLYQDLFVYNEGLMPFYDEKINKFGFINVEGQVIIKAKFNYVEEPFKNGKAKISNSNPYYSNDFDGDDEWAFDSYYYIDNAGNKIE